MTHKQKVLRLLSDGKPHTHHDCIPWIGYIAKDGYGRVNRRALSTSPLLAHRYAYEQAKGPISAGMEIHHRCGNRACVNVEHLELVTRLDHRRLEREAKRYCKRGHPFAIYGRNHGTRAAIYCTFCKSIMDRERRARAKATA